MVLFLFSILWHAPILTFCWIPCYGYDVLAYFIFTCLELLLSITPSHKSNMNNSFRIIFIKVITIKEVILQNSHWLKVSGFFIFSDWKHWNSNSFWICKTQLITVSLLIVVLLDQYYWLCRFFYLVFWLHWYRDGWNLFLFIVLLIWHKLSRSWLPTTHWKS